MKTSVSAITGSSVVAELSLIFASLSSLLFLRVSADPADGFDPLNLHEDEKSNLEPTHGTTEDGGHAVDHASHQGEIAIFKTHWDHVSAPLTISFWFFTVTIVKLVFHRFGHMHNLLPDSALLIVLGLFFGYIFHLIYPDEMYLKPDWFFLYLLPPIALDAGYFLPNKDFFRNFGTIMTYAVFGTLYNAFSIGMTLYLLSGFFKMQPSLIEILLFATLISAVDPVAVLCVFEEIHVNQLLYICVFGESLLNDAVTIVLYQTFNVMVGADRLATADYAKAGASFFVVSIGGILIGVIWAFVTGYTTKHAKHLNVVQPLICLLFPYLAYLTSELVAMSGILAIVMCGLMMKQFVVGNLSRKSLVTVQYFIKTLSSSCEAIIFVYLGISAVSKQHDWDFCFIIVTLVSCLIQRFVGVFLLTYLLNIRRVQKIGVVDQFIMSYGGIRGAVCYGLVMSLNVKDVPAKHMFTSCTIVVILFTVFVQGASIKWLVQLLKVKQNDVHKKTVFEMVGENVINNMMTGIEGITGYKGHYWFRQLFNRWNDLYVKPHLMCDTKSKASRLLDYHEHIQVKEAVQHLREFGSFAGMPSVQSKANIIATAGEIPPKVVDDSTYTGDGLMDFDPRIISNRSKESRISIPRNESLSVFVRDKLESLNSPLSYGVYSRHLLGVDNVPHLFSRRDDVPADSYFDSLDTDSYLMTYPYCKNALIIPARRKSRGGIQTDRPGYRMTDTSVVPTRRHDSIAAPRMSLREQSPKNRPRFLITSDPNDFLPTPPNAPRHPRRKSTEQELEEGFALKQLGKTDPNANEYSPPLAEKTFVDSSRREEIPQRKGPVGSRKSSLAPELDERHNLLPVIETEEPTESTGKTESAT